MVSELKIARVKADLSQCELSELLGVSQVTVSLWERGLREIPKQRAEQLSGLLPIDLQDMLPGVKK